MAKAGESLRTRLRAARMLVKPILSARELDKLAGLTANHVQAIETGRRTRVEALTVAKIATVIGVSLDWLIRGKGRQPKADWVSARVARRRKKFKEPWAWNLKEARKRYGYE